MKTFYIVVKTTYLMRGIFGKSTSLKEAMDFCKVKFKDNFFIYQAIVKPDATDEQIENLMSCFCVNDLGGINMYHQPSKEDCDMVEKLIIGWVFNNDFAG